MKSLHIFLLITTTVYLTSCASSPTDKAQSSVRSYMKENLKNSSSYEPLSFTELDTLEQADTSDTKKISLYTITHHYNITNSDNDKIIMTVSFHLDKNFNVNEANTKSINGDYGSLTGNAYWKYNNYIGNKPDAGSTVTFYSLDTIRGDLKFEATADVQGNYKIERIPPGKYFLIVRSNNATDCPDSHLSRLRIYSSDIKQLFGFDLDKYSNQVTEITTLDSLASAALISSDKGSRSSTRGVDDYYIYKEKSRDKANELIKLFPDDFIRKIKLYTGYSKAYDFEIMYIEEGKSTNQITDFGITCI